MPTSGSMGDVDTTIAPATAPAATSAPTGEINFSLPPEQQPGPSTSSIPITSSSAPNTAVTVAAGTLPTPTQPSAPMQPMKSKPHYSWTGHRLFKAASKASRQQAKQAEVAAASGPVAGTTGEYQFLTGSSATTAAGASAATSESNSHSSGNNNKHYLLRC